MFVEVTGEKLMVALWGPSILNRFKLNAMSSRYQNKLSSNSVG